MQLADDDGRARIEINPRSGEDARASAVISFSEQRPSVDVITGLTKRISRQISLFVRKGCEPSIDGNGAESLLQGDMPF